MRYLKTIPLGVEPVQKIELPFNSEIVHFGSVDGAPSLSAIIDDQNKSMQRSVYIVAENKDLEGCFNRTNYLGSFMCEKNLLHAFMDTK